MNYIWTEDTGAGFHFWELVNKYLFHGGFSVESKGSNQGILDAARKLGQKTETGIIWLLTLCMIIWM